MWIILSVLLLGGNNGKLEPHVTKVLAPCVYISPNHLQKRILLSLPWTEKGKVQVIFDRQVCLSLDHDY